MKTRIIVLFCAVVAVMMTACCGRSQSSSSCSHEHGKEKACSHDAAKAGCPAAQATCHASMKKIISAQVLIKPEKVDAFIAATKDLIEKSRAEEGCISYSLYQDPTDKTKFLFFEEWKNQAAVDFHFATEHFQKFGDVLNDCKSADAVITVYDSPTEKKL